MERSRGRRVSARGYPAAFASRVAATGPAWQASRKARRTLCTRTTARRLLPGTTRLTSTTPPRAYRYKHRERQSAWLLDFSARPENVHVVVGSMDPETATSHPSPSALPPSLSAGKLLAGMASPYGSSLAAGHARAERAPRVWLPPPAIQPRILRGFGAVLETKRHHAGQRFDWPTDHPGPEQPLRAMYFGADA